jgi:hypothetical protein
MAVSCQTKGDIRIIIAFYITMFYIYSTNGINYGTINNINQSR